MKINLELEKLKLHVLVFVGAVAYNIMRSSTYSKNKIGVQKFLPAFRAETDDITLFLVQLERLKLSKIPEHLWVSYQLSVVPRSISTLIDSESEENVSNFAFVKELLLHKKKLLPHKKEKHFGLGEAEQKAFETLKNCLITPPVLKFAPDSDTEEAQLVIPSQERENILKLHQDCPMSVHYDKERTYQLIAQRYYWTGIRSYISNCVKKFPGCSRFKATNQKLLGLLRTPAYAQYDFSDLIHFSFQRFETLSINLFSSLPESKEGHK
ncbi:reverse transcriptase [Caerostris darwini]|uniref:Reverse transcriptase n=1 Tax=Caerostris darwini TaxID=1538125 RepID=A0AAV4TFR5_9ARAC|nr:reverse transcriptase [Caerostris darwini]